MQLSPFIVQPVSDLAMLEHAIMGDIQAIDDVDDFVAETEEEIIELVCKAQEPCE